MGTPLSISPGSFRMYAARLHLSSWQQKQAGSECCLCWVERTPPGKQQASNHLVYLPHQAVHQAVSSLVQEGCWGLDKKCLPPPHALKVPNCDAILGSFEVLETLGSSGSLGSSIGGWTMFRILLVSASVCLCVFLSSSLLLSLSPSPLYLVHY